MRRLGPMATKKFLITGGTGAIGSFVVRAFVEKGFRPLVMDSRADFTLVNDLTDQFDFVSCDIADLNELMSIAKNQDVECIVHLAAVMPPVAQSNPLLGWRVNVLGTLHILECARELGIRRIVYSSSKAVLGKFTGEYSNPTYKPVDETHPFDPRSVYGATKLSSELMGGQYANDYGIQFLALRFSTTYGPGKLSRHGSVGLISRIIEAAFAGKELNLEERESVFYQKDDLTYNRDIAQAVLLAATVHNPLSRTVHIGGAPLYTLDDVLRTLEGISENVRIRITRNDHSGSSNATERNSCLLDITRARTELGYLPRYDLRQGILDYKMLMEKLKIQPLHY